MKTRPWTHSLRAALLAGGLLHACDDGAAAPSAGDRDAGPIPADSGSMEVDAQAETVSFARDLSPIFRQRCVICHRRGGLVVPYFDDPFGDGYSFIDLVNSWATDHESPYEVVVRPGNPDDSFLVYKLEADPDPDSFDVTNNGNPMPMHVERLGAQQLADVRQWIADGAANDAFFSASVAPIFGTEITLGRRQGKCTLCHYPDSPTGLDILDVFDDERGLVNAPSILSSKLRVAPGDPDASFLVEKLEQENPGAGQRMPLHYPRFSSAELATLRQWIAEGARDN